jgi:hypothetical protein
MAAVLDFAKRLMDREEKAELERLKAFFKELFVYATPAEKEAIKEALEAKNEEAYHAATSPIIMRMALTKANK